LSVGEFAHGLALDGAGHPAGTGAAEPPCHPLAGRRYSPLPGQSTSAKKGLSAATKGTSHGNARVPAGGRLRGRMGLRSRALPGARGAPVRAGGAGGAAAAIALPTVPADARVSPPASRGGPRAAAGSSAYTRPTTEKSVKRSCVRDQPPPREYPLGPSNPQLSPDRIEGRREARARTASRLGRPRIPLSSPAPGVRERNSP
jgi:hypothetical protein